ncbi:MAG: ABC transporter ATP-binding protein [Rhodospirillales bacterium]|jgi:branched-chain amino acid transport system ATP-binding protein
MLTVTDLNVWYGPTEVVRRVSFEVPAGRIVGLMGGNGAGKSTILKALSGLVQARSGSISCNGVSLMGRHPREIVVAGVVQVPQGRFVWPGMSVRDNLDLGAVTRSDKAEKSRTIEEVMSLFPTLARKSGDRAGLLSGGEQQMVAIGRAMMSKPRLMMMDEPSAGLSPKVVEEMIDAIRTLNRGGLSILLVEQNVGVAAALAEEAHILANGEISFTTSGRQLASDPQVIRSYLGR